MGYCDSPTHVSGNGGVCGTDGGTAEAAAAARDEQLKPRSVKDRGFPVRILKEGGRWLLLLLVRFYQIFLSPFFGGACKFYPSCSKYGYEAIAKHGAWRGSVLAMKRLLRCRPFTKGGFDPVPDVIDDAQQRVQGLKLHRAPVADVAAEAAAHKDQSKSSVHSAQGKQEFAQ
jgi:putative membrane protein insertion efficiency factor